MYCKEEMTQFTRWAYTNIKGSDIKASMAISFQKANRWEKHAKKSNSHAPLWPGPSPQTSQELYG